jgi:hypothetical protein
MLGAIPLVGNILNLGLAGSQVGGSAVNYALGDKAGAKMGMGYAQNNFLNAIPIFGNARSLGQGLHDQGAFYNNLFGGGTTPPETSGDIYNRESGPKLDSFLSSLF